MCLHSWYLNTLDYKRETDVRAPVEVLQTYCMKEDKEGRMDQYSTTLDYTYVSIKGPWSTPTFPVWGPTFLLLP